MPPLWTFTDPETGELIVREMTPEEWDSYPKNEGEIIEGPDAE